METSYASKSTIRPEYQLLVLGSPAALLVGGAGHTFTNSKHLALLAYLVLEPGEYTREHLMKFVWSSAEPGSVDNALSELRAVFGPKTIPLRARKIVFSPTLVDVDALRLLSALADSSLRSQAITGYRGPFLENFNARGYAEKFVRWVEKTRGSLEEAFRRLCDEECREASLTGDWQRVRSVAELGVRKSPEWTAGKQWLQDARVLRTELPDAANGETAFAADGEADLDASPGAADETFSPGPPARIMAAGMSGPRSRGMHSSLAVVTTTLLIVLLALVVRERRGPSIQLARMPPIRIEELPAPASPIDSLSDWLRTDGSWIYYRYDRYMPAACRHRTIAVGNFGDRGWTLGIPVVCLNAAWLAVDGERLVERFSLAPETTYCLQFLYREGNTSFWGQHGAEQAPGLASIRVVAPSGSYNIGFAVVRKGPGQHSLVLTHQYPGSRC